MLASELQGTKYLNQHSFPVLGFALPVKADRSGAQEFNAIANLGSANQDTSPRLTHVDHKCYRSWKCADAEDDRQSFIIRFPIKARNADLYSEQLS
ncbi:hypothetical protein KIN20_012535 [Parelaphostrongylus tenuis]|uniref:Uncharacterized protein n=1 Tax=Parelaphostrongylus tenuis TaxID=148309 RepID=A0AAD5QN79_PARTN|nr:hypothetical protein KIN20_012532 [Parelaphostrongylus tenuis]KAJ1355212.1 hypothetical protein KIN20_012535 [Parelaphostrongylus tenuis]